MEFLILQIDMEIRLRGSQERCTNCTIGLIGWFMNGILNTNRLSLILSTVLLLLYCYVFTLLQLQEFALLFASIGLFLTLAVIVHFFKKVQW